MACLTRHADSIHQTAHSPAAVLGTNPEESDATIIVEFSEPDKSGNHRLRTPTLLKYYLIAYLSRYDKYFTLVKGRRFVKPPNTFHAINVCREKPKSIARIRYLSRYEV